MGSVVGVRGNHESMAMRRLRRRRMVRRLERTYSTIHTKRSACCVDERMAGLKPPSVSDGSAPRKASCAREDVRTRAPLSRLWALHLGGTRG
jgi:hypothetical protein